MRRTKEEARKFLRNFDDVRFNGAGPFEEVYTHELCGSFNIERMKRDIVAMPLSERMKLIFIVPIGEDTKMAVNQADTSTERIASMPLDVVLNVPVIFLIMEDGTGILGDGNHRVMRAIQLGIKELRALVIPWEMVQKYKVTIEIRHRATKKWRPMPPDLDLAIMEGDFRHHAFI